MMKSIIKVIILSILIVVIAAIAHPISMSIMYVGITASIIMFILLGMIFGELSLIISKLFKIFFRKRMKY